MTASADSRKSNQLQVSSTVLFKTVNGESMQAVDICIYQSDKDKATASVQGHGDEQRVDLIRRRDHLWGRFLVPELEEIKNVQVAVGKREGSFDLLPRKKWRVHILHFSHTDTGYTDLPSRVARDHGRFLRDIVQYCRETDDYPEDAKFRWTSETGYQFLNGWERLTDGEQAEVIERIREGRIEVAPIHLAHTTDLYDPEVLYRTLQQMTTFGQKHGISFTSGMNTDITGLPWALVKVLNAHGIKYLTTAVNATRGRAPDIPRPVWWEAMDGSRVLLYQSDPKNAYIEGSNLGFVDGLHILNDKLPRYLQRYESEEYPYDVIGFRTAGQNADNAGPVRVIPDIIRDWNNEWDYPRAISSTNGNFMSDMDEHWGQTIPSIRKAWPDWWMDTFGTVARSTAVSRQAHSHLWTGESLATMANILRVEERYPREEIHDALTNLTLADETDTSASDGIVNPDGLQAHGQFHEQQAFAYKGAINAEEVLELGSEACFAQLEGDGSSIIVVNPLSWDRSSHVVVSIPRIALDELDPVFQDPNGVEIESQLVGEDVLERRFILCAPDLPPLGAQQYSMAGRTAQEPEAVKPLPSLSDVSLENDLYRVVLASDGTVAEIQDKACGANLVDKDHQFGFNQVIYETIHGDRPRVSFDRMLAPQEGHEVDLDFMEHARWMFPARFPDRDTRFNRICPVDTQVISLNRGPVFDEVVLRSSVGKITRLDRLIRLYHKLKRLDFIVEMDKTEVRDVESVYVAFPFALEDFQLEVDNAYSFLIPESGQMPESARDWYTVQKYIRLWNDQQSIVWSPLEAPLIQLGRIQTGKWQHTLECDSAAIYSWPMNNHWWTNVPAGQGGWNYRFGYSMTSSSGSGDRVQAYHFGSEHHLPAQAQYVEQTREGRDLTGGLIGLSNANIIVSALKLAERGRAVVIRIFNLSTSEESTQVQWHGPALKSVQVLTGAEEPVKMVSCSSSKFKLSLAPEEVLTLGLEC